MNRQVRIATVVGAAFVTTVGVIAGERGSPTYDLSWNTIDGGGGTSTGGTFALSGTIGQPDAGGPMTGGTYELVGGFWPGAGQPTPSCQGDINNSGVVDVGDLIAVILGWGGCPNCPPNHCSTDIAPFPNGNCATDVSDLVAVILNWGPC